MLPKYAGTRSTRRTSLTEHFLLLCNKDMLSSHQYTGHHLGLKLITQHHILLPISFLVILCKQQLETFLKAESSTAEIKSNPDPNKFCLGFIFSITDEIKRLMKLTKESTSITLHLS